MSKKNLIIILILLLHVSSLILYHIFGYIGHYGFDDLQYAKLANDLTNGIIDYNDHFTYRIPIIFLTALSYSLFGIFDFASSLPPLIITISILLLVFFTLKNTSYLTLLIGLSLTTFSNWFIFYSDKLMPDIYVAFSIMLTLFIIHKYKFNSNKKRPVLYSVLLSFSLLFGFTAKETIILIIPLLLYIFIVDVINKRDVKFWIYSFVSGALMLFIYFFVIWILTNDFAKRFEAIAQNNYLNLCSYDKLPVRMLLKRITFEFFNLLVCQAMITGFIFVVAFLIQKKIKNFFQISESFSFYLVSAVILFLSSNFMTISLTAYIPMCLDPRHYLFLTPIIAISASFIITEYIKTKQHAIQILLSLFLVTTLSFFLQGNTFWKLYLPLTILFGLFYLLRKSNRFQWIFILIFVFILMVIPFDMIKYAQKINYWEQKEIVKKYIIDKNEDCYIITDEVQKNLGEYFNGFSKKNNYTFLSYNKFSFDTLGNKKKLLLLNWYTQYLSGFDMNDLPYYAKKIDTANVLVYKNNDLNISIYELKKNSILATTSTEILYSFNGFEQKIPYWEQDNANRTHKIKYEGDYSMLVNNEYSSTFSYQLDSLPINKFTNIIILSKLYCNVEEKTNSKLVISIETKDGVYVWYGLEINKYINAYSNWCPIKFEVEINANDIKNASLLKVFLWNIDKRKIYIDNFNIKIKAINR